jgi:hypothetical protein
MEYGSVIVTLDFRRNISKPRTAARIMDVGFIHARRPNPNVVISSFGTMKQRAEKHQLC